VNRLVSKLVSGAVVYGLSSMLPRAVGILLMPVYTLYMSPSEFGILQFVLAVVAFGKLVVNLGLTTSFWKFYSGTDSQRANVLSNILFCQLYLGLGAVLIGYLVQGLWARDPAVFPSILLLLAGETVAVLFETVLLVLRADSRKSAYFKASLLYSLCFGACNLLFLAVLRCGYQGVIYAYCASYAIAGIAWFRTLHSRLGGAVDLRLVKEVASYGFPIMIGNLAGTVVSLSDRLILKLYVDDHALGLYAFGFKLGDLVKVLLVVPFFLAWNPMRWEIYHMPNGQAVFAKLYRALFCGFTSAGLCVIATGPALCTVLASDPAFYKGVVVSPIIGFADILYGLYYFNVMGMLFANRTKGILGVVILGSLLSVGLNFTLVPLIGIYGPAVAAVCAYLLMYAIAIYGSQRCYPISRNYVFEFFYVALAGTAAAGISLATCWVSNLVLLTCLSLLVALGYLAVCFTGGGVPVQHVIGAVRGFRTAQRGTAEL